MKQNRSLCFRNYIPPHISIPTPSNPFCSSKTFIFGCQVDRNQIQENLKFVYKLTNLTEEEPYCLYDLALANDVLPTVRLNSGICRYTSGGKDKVILIGGNTGKSLFKNYEQYQKHLFRDCLVYDVETEKFEEDRIGLRQQKDWTTGVWVGEWVYSFFGRTLGIMDREKFYEPGHKYYTYCKQVDRWKIDSEQTEFETIEISFHENVEKWLKPMVFHEEGKFLIIGGIRSNQTPLAQIWELDLGNNEEPKADEEEQQKLPEVGPVKVEIEKEEGKEETKEDDKPVTLQNSELSTPLSFPYNASINNETTVATIGFTATGRAWCLKYLKNDKNFTVQPLL